MDWGQATIELKEAIKAVLNDDGVEEVLINTLAKHIPEIMDENGLTTEGNITYHNWMATTLYQLSHEYVHMASKMTMEQKDKEDSKS